MVEYDPIMGKIKQRNWLIIITIFLVIVSGIGLFVSIQQKLSFNSCAYGEDVYRSGEQVPEFNGEQECTCNSDGSIKCGTESDGIVYTGYSSSNLRFSYSYINLLDSGAILDSDITPLDASYSDGILKISFERDVLCSSDEIAPAQSGFYQLSSDALRLTIMTNIDTTKYTSPCKISNTFEITDSNITFNDDFQIYYESDSGEFLSLGACVYKGVLHGDQDVFKDKDISSVCLCNTGNVTCKDLQ